MDLLHITPRALARVSCLSLLPENSPGRPFSITAVCPTSVSILNLLLILLPFTLASCPICSTLAFCPIRSTFASYPRRSITLLSSVWVENGPRRITTE